jgi:hypothetical protein
MENILKDYQYDLHDNSHDILSSQLLNKLYMRGVVTSFLYYFGTETVLTMMECRGYVTLGGLTILWPRF